MTGDRPILIVVAGPNGSGKTTITKKLLMHQWMQGCEYINPDEIAQHEFGGWNDRTSILKAAQRAEQIRNACIADRKSLALETVFSADDKVEFIKAAHKAGFFIRVFFVCTSEPSINITRVGRRVLEGGHEVPMNKIISRYYKSIANCVTVAPLVDRLYFYDNSAENEDAKLLFKVKEGAIAKVYEDLEPWAEDIVEAIPKEHSAV